jgi:hypothetical protein
MRTLYEMELACQTDFFFETNVHSLKSDVRLRSLELRKNGDEPRRENGDEKFCIRVRTDVVIVNGYAVSINRQTSRIAIEVKPEEFAVFEGLREAFLQLVGLIVSNENISSCVILTNFAKHTMCCILSL